MFLSKPLLMSLEHELPHFLGYGLYFILAWLCCGKKAFLNTSNWPNNEVFYICPGMQLSTVSVLGTSVFMREGRKYRFSLLWILYFNFRG